MCESASVLFGTVSLLSTYTLNTPFDVLIWGKAVVGLIAAASVVNELGDKCSTNISVCPHPTSIVKSFDSAIS
jgi:hypothetical protein